MILTLVANLTSFGQRDWDNDGVLNFCNEEGSKSRVGQKVKIWSNGGVLTGINRTRKLKWPSRKVKVKSGKNAWGTFYPETGDTGTIVHVFDHDKGRVASQRLIYLLYIRGFFVPIGCGYLTTIDKMDENKESEHRRIQDSIRQNRYAKGCKFKEREINNCFNRAGSNYPIDTLPEIFICSLKYSGIDTLMLCKYIYDNGSSSYEKVFVLWIDKGEGFIKGYYNNETYQPMESEVKKFEVLALLNDFFRLNVNNVKGLPKSNLTMSHSMGYCMQVMVPDLFYCERLPSYLVESDLKNPKSIWWKQVENSINENRP